MRVSAQLVRVSRGDALQRRDEAAVAPVLRRRGRGRRELADARERRGALGPRVRREAAAAGQGPRERRRQARRLGARQAPVGREDGVRDVEVGELLARVVGVPQRVGAGRRDGGRAAEARAGLAHGGRRREPEAPQRS